jgi:hypothetical protein
VEIVLNAHPTCQQRAKPLCVRRLPQVIPIRDIHRVSNFNKAIFAGSRTRTRTTARNECLAAIELKFETEPGHRPPNRSLGNLALPSAKAIVNDINESRLSGLGCAGDDVHATRIQRKYAAAAVVTENDYVKDLHR